jgi:protein-arginine kinase activator protein McsA
MRYIKNNEREGYKEIKLKCNSCGAEWTPFSKSGLTMCSACGRDWTNNGFKRIS